MNNPYAARSAETKDHSNWLRTGREFRTMNALTNARKAQIAKSFGKSFGAIPPRFDFERRLSFDRVGNEPVSVTQ
jgi:hypothetical protein